MVYLEKFILPDEEQEYVLARRRMAENGGPLGYLDNGYPCGLFPQRGLSELDFEPITVFCGGNGSGKSTLLNAIAQKTAVKADRAFQRRRNVRPVLRRLRLSDGL